MTAARLLVLCVLVALGGGAYFVFAPTPAERLATLTRAARAEATADDVNPAVSADLLSSSQAVAVARRDRLMLAGHGLPAPLFLLVFTTAIVICLNVVVLALALTGWVTLIVGGLVIVIALDLALVVAISDPFVGPMRALPGPIELVCLDLESGRFGPLEDEPPA